MVSDSVSAIRSSPIVRHSEARDVGARGRRALLALVLERTAYQRRPQHRRVGRRVGDDEVLAAGLADEPGIAAVGGEVVGDALPELLEDPGRAGEVDAGELGVGEHDLGDRDAVAGDQVEHAGRQAGRLEQPHREVGRELLGRRGLPHDDVAHERGRERQVAGDGGEVERRDRVDEALERAVVEPVPDAGARRRLLLEQPPAEGDVEAEEVDQLAGRVDLRLVRRLGLAEHGRRVEPVAPRAGQQVGGLEQDRGPLVVRHRCPAGASRQRRVDRVGGVLRGWRCAGCPAPRTARAAGRPGPAHRRRAAGRRRSSSSGRRRRRPSRRARRAGTAAATSRARSRTPARCGGRGSR